MVWNSTDPLHAKAVFLRWDLESPWVAASSKTRKPDLFRYMQVVDSIQPSRLALQAVGSKWLCVRVDGRAALLFLSHGLKEESF